MSPPRTVFLVSDGWYSDYKILHIASTREKAEYAHRLFKCDNDIEEWEVDTEYPMHERGWLLWWVYMNHNGDTRRVCQTRPETSTSDWAEKWQPVYKSTDVLFQVWAKDKQHAIKIANERRVQLIASGEWTTDWNEWWERGKERKD